MIDQRRTKIVCTLGPACTDPAIIEAMMNEGMDVARINFSHGDHAEHLVRINMIKELREKLGLPVALLADTRGPEIRLGLIEGGKTTLVDGQKLVLTTKEMMGNSECVSITYKNLPMDLKKGKPVLIDDGLIEMVAESVSDMEISCRVIHGGTISSRKGVNVPGTKLSMPYVNSRDRADLRFIVEQGFDFVAASFVRSENDIIQLRQEIERVGGSDIRIISKIENAEGVEDADDIIRHSDGIMVARGDMGVEIPFEEIPMLQKMLIKKAYTAGKQVITATQMLESMIHNPRPTRAETTDVANSIYDGTSAIMLSGETAAGSFPVEAVRTMARIARRTERDINYISRFNTRRFEYDMCTITNAISHATCAAAHDLNAACIITVTKSGETAKIISKFRPNCPIIGCSPSQKAVRQMNLSWGVIPVLIDEKMNTDELFAHSVGVAEEKHLVDKGDLVVITAGVPLGVSGTTNMLRVNVVGEPLM